MKRLAATMFVLFGLLTAAGLASSPELRLHAVKIKVTDMKQAIEFYSGVLGFRVDSMQHYPGFVLLHNETVPLWLEEASLRGSDDQPQAVRTGAGFQARDLAKTIRALESQGVKFLYHSPRKVGVGISTHFRDPFGNLLYYLEQQVGPPEEFQEPRIYNVGFRVPDMEKARRFYCGLLGFVVRSEKYFPAVPLGHRDGTFAFMLHEEKDLPPARIDYPKQRQTVVVLETSDLESLLRTLSEAGVEMAAELPFQTPLGRSAAVRDPFGNVFEIVEVKGEIP